jgi:hypothetical protein
MTLRSRAAIAAMGAVVFLSTLAACTDVGTVRVGPAAPPRPLDCSLELIDAAPGSTPAGLELLGYVQVVHAEGKTPSDPEVLKLLKPEACKLGGEKVSPGMSANYSTGFRTSSSNMYMVWRRKVASAGPHRF